MAVKVAELIIAFLNNVALYWLAYLDHQLAVGFQ